MGQISVAEAARRLGVGVPRIHQRIADGSLPATRIGSQWVIDEASLPSVSETSAPGRPLSQRSACALLAISEANLSILDTLAPAEKSRAGKRMRRLLSLLDVPPSEDRTRSIALLLRSWLRNRAERRTYRASPRDLPDLRIDDRVVLSGLSHSRSGMATLDLVEGYITAKHLDSVVGDYLLSAATAGRDSNVVLHVISVDVSNTNVTGPLWMAADLAEHHGPREEARAVELLTEIPKYANGPESLNRLERAAKLR